MISLWHNNSQLKEAGTVVTFTGNFLSGYFLIQQQDGFLHWAQATPALALGSARSREDRRRPWQLCSILGHMALSQLCPKANTHPWFSAWRIVSDWSVKDINSSHLLFQGQLLSTYFKSFLCLGLNKASSFNSLTYNLITPKSLSCIEHKMRIFKECSLMNRFVSELVEQHNLMQEVERQCWWGSFGEKKSNN